MNGSTSARYQPADDCRGGDRHQNFFTYTRYDPQVILTYERPFFASE